MKNVLVTGGTVFVSRYVAEYYAKKGFHVFVLNRNSKPQSDNVTLIEADRHHVSSELQNYKFDVIFDMTAYSADDVERLLGVLDDFGDYILLSSSAVYPEYCSQPFSESTPLGENKFWGQYGIGKIAAEQALLKQKPDGYIIRPPYLYGPMNNVYREAFVFECALNDRKFYLPKDGEMKLQFFYIDDLCRFMDIIMEQKPDRHVFNVGNQETVSVRDWVSLCYEAVGRKPEFVRVCDDIEQRNYFSFYDYEYCLDVSGQQKWMPAQKPLKDGIRDSFKWYVNHTDMVNRKPYMEYIDANLK